MPNQDVLAYFTDDTRIRLAHDLNEHVKPFCRYAEFKNAKNEVEREKIGNLDFQFDMSAGKIKDDVSANTWLAFDVKQDTLLFEFMRAMYAREVTDEETKQIKDFLDTVAKKAVENHLTDLRESLRRAVLPDTDPRTFPLEKIEILDVELVDYSSVEPDDKRTVQYIKLPGETVNMQAVSSRIMAVREEFPKMSINDVIIKERKAANPVFDAVMGANLGAKYLWDCNVSLCVDYSMSEEFLKIQEQAAAENKEKTAAKRASRTPAGPVKTKKPIKRLF
jgi:hypothetical protein